MLIGTRSLSQARSERTIRLSPCLDRLGGLATNAVQCRLEPGHPFGPRIGDVDRPRFPAAVIEMPQRRQLAIGEDRMLDGQAMALLFGRFEKVAFRTDIALQRHDDLFADRIDRRIGHLREQLPEIVVQHPRLIAQTFERRVVPHRAERIFFLVQQRDEHEAHRFGRIAEGLHPREQIMRLVMRRDRSRRELFEPQPLTAEPFAVRAACWRLRASVRRRQ